MNKFIKVYDRYIFKQVLLSTSVAILLFIVVWIAPEMLLNVIQDILNGDTTVQKGLYILICEVPKILGKAFPVGLLLGTLFTFDKLSKDSELTIFRAVGISFPRIFAPLLVLSILVTMLCFITYDKLIPLSTKKLFQLKGGTTRTQFIYTQKDGNNHPKIAVVVSKFCNNVMNGIIILDFSEQIYNDLHALKNVRVAENGVFSVNKDGKTCWLLNNITSYDINDDGVFNKISNIKSQEILEGEPSQNAYNIMINSTKRDRDLDNATLKNYTDLLKKEGLDEEYRLNLNKYYQRFLHPFVCILLAILGCLLGFSKPREQRLIGFTIAIGFIFAYYITLPFFDLLAEKGVLNPFLTASIPPIAFLCAIIAFYKHKGV